MRGTAIFLALVLFFRPCSGSCAQTADLPELPRIVSEKFLPAIRDEVEKAYADALAHPREASANGKLGMILQAHSQLNAAAVCYQRATLLDPGSFRWVYYLGLIEAAEGKYDGAVGTLRRALRIDPNYLPAQVKLAECLLALAEWEESRKIYESTVEKHPDNAAAHYGLGRVRAARHDLKGAAESYRRACELFPEFGAAHYALALAYRDLALKDQSLGEFGLYQKNVTSAPPAADPLLAEVQALNLNPVSRLRLGSELERAGQLEQSVVTHEKALEIDPQLVQAHVNLISLYARLGQIEKAEEHYRAAVQLNPNSPESHYDYGVLLVSQNKYSEAEEAFRKTLEINPFHAEARNNLGYVLEQQGKLSEAAEQYRIAIENKPAYRLAHFHLGRILANQGNYREAIQEFLKTLEPEDQSTPTYLYALGATYARADDRETALRYLHRAREQASARGQVQLLISIEKDLRTLEGQGAAH